MAEATPKPAAAEQAATPAKGKKSWPTNCVQSNKRIRRKDWYYRNGMYFANKSCFKLYIQDLAKKAQKAQEEAAAKAKSETPAAQ